MPELPDEQFTQKQREVATGMGLEVFRLSDRTTI